MTTAARHQKTKTLKFRKMHGLGNDFVMVDCVRASAPAGDPAELARAVCDRRFGVGADGLIYMERDPHPQPPLHSGNGEGAFRMRMWNPDGSESEMCGNGIRCVARYLVDEGIVRGREQGAGAGVGGHGIPVQTGAGLLVLEDAGGGLVRVDMGVAGLTRGEIGMVGPAEERFVNQGIGVGAGGEDQFRGTAVSMGNPHLVLLVDDAKAIDLAKVGPVLERHELFPNRVNVHFVQVLDRGHIVQRTWERGAGATLACGTGACASVVAAFLNGRTGRVVDVDLPGGRLRIEYAEDGRVFMTGPATTVYDGEWPLQ